LFSKSKTKKNLKKIMFLKLKENKVINKINKFFSLLLKFLILFKSKTTLCCFCNIIARFKLTLTKLKNLSIALIVFNYLKKNKNRQILLF